MTHNEFYDKVSCKTMRIWEDNRQNTKEGREELDGIHRKALKSAKHGKWYAGYEYWLAYDLDCAADEEEFQNQMALAQDESSALRDCGFTEIADKLDRMIGIACFRREKTERNAKKEIARDILRYCWNDDAAGAIEACDRAVSFNGTAVEFLSFCDTKYASNVRILLTGIKKLWPEVYASIPWYIDSHSYNALVALLFLCGVRGAENM